MPMRSDPLLVAALARELGKRLHGARLRSLLLDGDGRRVVLYFRTSTLVFELHPRAGWISSLPPEEPLAEARPLASRVVSVRAIPDESALVMGLQRVRGRDEGVEVVVEWVGNRWNAVVVGYRSRIIRHVLIPRDERNRTLAPGHPYAPPPSNHREGADGELSEERWQRILADLPEGDPTGEPRRDDGPDRREARRRALLASVAYTSSINVDRFLEADGWVRWRESLDPSGWSAYLVETPRGPQPYPISLTPHEAHPFPGLLEAMAAARSREEDDPARLLTLPPGLMERVRRRLTGLEGRARGMRRELDRAPDPAPVRALGDLILARYGDLPRGVERARLRDFSGGEVEVELDPRLPPHENADRYYREAARIERARRELPARIQAAEEAAAEWRGILDELSAGSADPARVLERLGPERAGRQSGPASGPSLPYHRFRSSGGLEIRVGRGARRNDELTFHHSSPDDIWLHTRQSPGAHVILRWSQSGNPPRRDLTEAAVLAALNSEARHAGSVPVDWTRRKYVRKPRKGAAGAVIPQRVETLFVEPDPELPDRLKDESG
ncbi:MAG: DUF814 domain-containing protein [Gemmatimonadales bacterium]|nr:MAG: DUF814 domain-containing protein [Gemmatimonadales bacterium]